MIFKDSTTVIPDELIIRHLEGNVVFFCGAGISYDAGLPLFDELILKTREKAGLEFDEEEAKLFDQKSYDTLYQRMERKMGERPEDKTRLREITAQLLRPHGAVSPTALENHRSILSLSRAGEDRRLHLITTNFDSLFDLAAKRLRLNLRNFTAPLLPIPKEYKWDGLVYLHGKLDKSPTPDNLNSLILSSGDFGIGYLTERWAARFLTELFRRYTICFVGYSVNDPIMRYMMDALAAENMLGEDYKPVYAFDGYTDGERDSLASQWSNKGITVIPYLKPDKHDHGELRRTLSAWADTYTAKFSGKERIVADEATVNPNDATPAGRSAITRILWAIADPSGIPAAQFANYTPLPSVDWFDILNEKGLLPLDDLQVPSAHKQNLALWMARHVNNPRLLEKLILLRKRIGTYLIGVLEDSLTHPQKSDEQDSDEKAPPINDRLASLWLLWLESQRQKRTNFREQSLALWFKSYAKQGLTTGLSIIFADLMRPTLEIDKRDVTPWTCEDAKADDPTSAFSLDYTIAAQDAASHTASFMRPEKHQITAEFLPSLSAALDTLCRMRQELGTASETEDVASHYDLQDMASPDEERTLSQHGWAVLPILMQTAWSDLLRRKPKNAVRTAKNWFCSPYPIFRRLALCVAACSSEFDAGWVIRHIRHKHPEMLTSPTYRREIRAFLLKRGKDIPSAEISKLMSALTSIRNQELDDKRRDRILAHLLDHLKDGGAVLPDNASEVLRRFESTYPGWNNRTKQFDGLSFYVTDENPFEDDAASKLQPPPTDDSAELKRWLADYESRDLTCLHDPWGEYANKNPVAAFKALLEFGEKASYWPTRAWHALLGVSSDAARSALWQQLEPLPSDALPPSVVIENSISLAALFVCAAKGKHDPVQLISNILSLLGLLESNRPPACEMAMEALLRSWYATHPRPSAGIAESYQKAFSLIVAGKTDAYRVARNELFPQLGNLSTVDPAWTFGTLTPLLRWSSRNPDAAQCWAKAVHMRNFNSSLMVRIKADFIATAGHYDELGMSAESYAHLVLLMSVSKVSGYNASSYRRILKTLPPLGRKHVANAIHWRLDAAGGKADECWHEEIKPFLTRCWPLETEFMDAEIAGEIVAGIAYCSKAFPDAVQTILKTIRGGISLRNVAFRLANPPKDSPQPRCAQFPAEALELLSRTEDSAVDYTIALYLRKCLQCIQKGDPSLANDRDFQRLDKLCKLHYH